MSQSLQRLPANAFFVILLLHPPKRKNTAHPSSAAKAALSQACCPPGLLPHIIDSCVVIRLLLPCLSLGCAAPGHVPLLPRLWSDPYAIAAVLHGAWRTYVVTSGMFYAYTIYASINKGITQTRLVHTHTLHRHLGSTAGSSSSSGGGGGGGVGVLGARRREGRLVQPVVGPVQPLRHHLSQGNHGAGGCGGMWLPHNILK
jgi:hypothetical protein